MNQNPASALLQLFGACPPQTLRPLEITLARYHFALAEHQGAEPPKKYSRQFLLTGDPSKLSALRQALSEVAKALNIEIAIERLPTMPCRLIAMDMDSTLIKIEVINELAKFNNAQKEVEAITDAALNGEIDFAESLRQRTQHLKGLEVNKLKQVELPLSDGAAELINHLKRNNCKLALITSGFDFFARHLGAQHGFDYVCANSLEARDGKLSGKLKQPVIDGKAKANNLRKIAKQEDIPLSQVMAIGDGANDIPMLRTAGASVCFRGKHAVNQVADYSVQKYGLDSLIWLCSGLRHPHIQHAQSQQ